MRACPIVSRIDFNAPRLFLDLPLSEGAEVTPDRDQQNYLVNVLRLTDGAQILAFNGRDGEWRMTLRALSRKLYVLHAEARVREQTPGTDLHYLF
ncbi:MAG: rRNA methyltransferase, partial [Hyphomicrobiales bacterium]|nr:rRNA methyltransferase [Hyphomicrobiales bacterium]